jgi:hypothetical protein
MALVEGGDRTLKLYSVLGFLTIEYLCVQKLGIGVSGYGKYMNRADGEKSAEFQIRDWCPTPEGAALVAVLGVKEKADLSDGGRVFFQAKINRVGRYMCRFTQQPSEVPPEHRNELIEFLEAFCDLCGYKPDKDDMVRATRNFIQCETKANLAALTHSAVKKMLVTPCFNEEIRLALTSICANGIKSVVR